MENTREAGLEEFEALDYVMGEDLTEVEMDEGFLAELT